MAAGAACARRGDRRDRDGGLGRRRPRQLAATGPGPPRSTSATPARSMRFLPPVAALADGAVRFDGDPRVRERPLGAAARRAARARRPTDDGPRPLPVTVHGAGALRGGPVERGRVRVLAVRQRRCCSPAPRFDEGVEVRHVGPAGCRRAPHIAMTVTMLREAGAQVDDAETRRDAGGSRPGALRGRDAVVEPDLSNAAPFLAAALVDRRPGHRAGLAGSDTTQPGDALREILAAMGARVSADRRRPDRHRAAAVDPRHRRRPARRAASSRRCSPRSPRSPTARAGSRRRATCGCTRPTGSPRSPRSSARLGGDVPRSRRRPVIEPRPLHGGVLRHLRRPPAGAWPGPCSGSAVAGVAGRGRGDDRARRAGLLGPVDRMLAAGRAGRRAEPAHELDEDDVRVRPGRGLAAAHPHPARRTRTPPPASVVTVDRGRYRLRWSTDGAAASRP